MALIKCLECGKEISDKALLCVHCRCPIKIENDKYNIKLLNYKDGSILNTEI